MTMMFREVSVQTKLKEVKKRVLPRRPLRPITHIGKNIDAHHTVFSPLNNNKPLKSYSEKLKFADVFDAVRKNFKNYTTKAAHHLNSYYIQPHAEQKLIDRHFAGDEKLQSLAKYLDMLLEEFEQNALRFMPNIKNTDYKLDISASGRDKSDVRIGFKNAKGKQVGPFLTTHITTSPLDGYDFLSVNIGYIDKRKQPIITHSFDYNILNEADKIAERRGDKTFIKTDAQITHDEFAGMTVKKTKERLIHKRDGFEI